MRLFVAPQNFSYQTVFRRLQNIDRAWNSFYRFVDAHIRSITEDISKEKDNDEDDSRNADVLRRLIASSESDGKYRLSEQEVVRFYLRLLRDKAETYVHDCVFL